MNMGQPEWDQIPPEIQEQILDNLDIFDLSNVCLLSPCSPDYFVHRLKLSNIPLNIFWNPSTYHNSLLTETIFPNYRPSNIKEKSYIDRYVITLVHNDMHSLGMFKYIYESNIIFTGDVYHIFHPKNGLLTTRYIYGVEHFIGIVRAAKRAIDEGDLEYLVYILTLYPTQSELSEILAALIFKYYETEDEMYKSDVLFKLLPSTGFIKYGRYNPITKEEYLSYITGYNGKFQSLVNDAYLCGIISGKQNERFFTIPTLSIDRCSKIAKYIGINGTIEMVGHIASLWPMYTEDIINYAIYGNNLEVVDKLLDGLGRTKITEPPNSLKMVKLLESKGYKYTTGELLKGLVKSSDYDLMEYFADIDISTNLTNKELISLPKYLIHLYMVKNHDSVNLDDLFNYAIMFNNINKASFCIKMGCQQPQQNLCINDIINMKLVEAIGLDMRMYPNLDLIARRYRI